MSAKGYKMGGGEENPDSPDCLAKEVKDEVLDGGDAASPTYWLKTGTVGAECGKLFDPNGVLHQPGSESKAAARLGKNRYEFKRVSREKFETYLRFLKTGNPLHLRFAERL